jgi:hypothetical protein
MLWHEDGEVESLNLKICTTSDEMITTLESTRACTGRCAGGAAYLSLHLCAAKMASPSCASSSCAETQPPPCTIDPEALRNVKYHPDTPTNRLSGRLGHLTDDETAALVQMKSSVDVDKAKATKLLIPGEYVETCLLRFLRARDFNVTSRLFPVPFNTLIHLFMLVPSQRR